MAAQKYAAGDHAGFLIASWTFDCHSLDIVHENCYLGKSIMSQALLLSLFQIVVLIYSVVLHEVAHGFIARSMGDYTAERLGRLTLNPLKHLDLFGSVVLPLLSKLLTGFMIGYAKPVPYNPNNLSDRRYGPAKVAAAGPLTNLLLALIVGLILRFAGPYLGEFPIEMLKYIVVINIVLAFFNLMPVPPLDGHWLLMAFLPVRFYRLRFILYRYQWLFLVLLIFFVFPLFTPVLSLLFQLLTGMRLF